MAASPARPPSLVLPASPISDVASRNVTARLFNCNAVKEVLAEIIPDIQAAMGVLQRESTARKRSQSVHVTDNPRLTLQDADDSQKDFSPVSDPFQTEHDGEDGDVERPRVPPLSGDLRSQRSSSYGNVSTEAPNMSIREASNNGATMPVVPHAAGTQPAFVCSDGAEIMGFNPQSPGETSKHPYRSSRASRRPFVDGSSSAFLPALSMGGYWSGSDEGDHISDSDAVADADLRKNRRGQRARRQLWEKKYGSKAKHLDGQARGGPDIQWDSQRGALAVGPRRFTRGAVAGKHQRVSGESGLQRRATFQTNSSATREAKKREAEKPLHPSWEAAKRAKERGLNASFQGIKIVFD